MPHIDIFGTFVTPQDAFEALLVEPLLAESNEGAGLSMASAKQLKHVIFKNLAALLAESDESAMRALQLYGQALLLDDGDAVVWNRMGTLVSVHSLHAFFFIAQCLSGVLELKQSRAGIQS